jgi:hypothetical protein
VKGEKRGEKGRMLCATRGEREERLSPLYALFSPLYPLFLRLAKIELPLFKNYGMTQRCIEEGPRRGHTCITAGLDPRNMHICKGTTSKMSHITINQINELAFLVAVRPLWGRYLFMASSFRRSRPAVKHSATSRGRDDRGGFCINKSKNACYIWL